MARRADEAVCKGIPNNTSSPLVLPSDLSWLSGLHRYLVMQGDWQPRVKAGTFWGNSSAPGHRPGRQCGCVRRAGRSHGQGAIEQTGDLAGKRTAAGHDDKVSRLQFFHRHPLRIFLNDGAIEHREYVTVWSHMPECTTDKCLHLLHTAFTELTDRCAYSKVQIPCQMLANTQGHACIRRCQAALDHSIHAKSNSAIHTRVLAIALNGLPNGVTGHCGIGVNIRNRATCRACRGAASGPAAPASRTAPRGLRHAIRCPQSRYWGESVAHRPQAHPPAPAVH